MKPDEGHIVITNESERLYEVVSSVDDSVPDCRLQPDQDIVESLPPGETIVIMGHEVGACYMLRLVNDD